MKITIAGILLGLVIGYAIPLEIPESATFYVVAVIFASLDSIFGGIYSKIQVKFDLKAYLIGFLGNVILACFIIFVGDILDVNLATAVVVVFGIRIFNIFSEIRKILLQS